MEDYQAFLARKAAVDPPTGLAEIPTLPEQMFPHQRDITSWALRRGRAAIFAGTGLGKTLMELAWAQAIHGETGRDILHFAPLAVAAQIEREAAKFSIPVKRVKSQSDCVPGINITNYQKLDHFDLSRFGGVILDECFSGETLVDVIENGEPRRKHIKNIRIGDSIINASGVDAVSDVHRREIPYAVQVQMRGQTILASPNHPFLTHRGWIGAQDLEPGDCLVSTGAALRMVRGLFSGEKSARENEAVLRQVLLSEMADASAGGFSRCAFARSGRETRGQESALVQEWISGSGGRIGAYPVYEPDFQHGSESENLPHIESHEARTFRAWGKWPGDDQAAGNAFERPSGNVDTGISLLVGRTKTRISDALQNRLGQQRAESRYRGGWSVSCLAERIGCEEGRDAHFIRVEGIEVLKCCDPRLDSDRAKDGKLYFYDLGGTRHPSFSVNGALVHNSSILKAYDGHYRSRLISECADVPFRLAATATPAPNDFMELGNHAEFLGVMSYTDMLATFFVHDGGDTQKWRLKGHAEDAFWKWMASWSVMLRTPGDLGYPNDGYDLPTLHQRQHVVGVQYAPSIETGMLFPMQAATLQERISARRDTVTERVAKALEIVDTSKPFLVWCNLNSEQDALEKAFGHKAFSVRGSMSDDAQEQAIVGWLRGERMGMVSKPSMLGFGLNFQHCAQMVFVGLNDSFEQVYQAIRRCWRFGQTEEVDAHFIAAETEGAVVANLKRKEMDAERMAAAMVRHTADLSAKAIRGMVRDRPDYDPQVPVQLPAWLGAAE